MQNASATTSPDCREANMVISHDALWRWVYARETTESDAGLTPARIMAAERSA